MLHIFVSSLYFQFLEIIMIFFDILIGKQWCLVFLIFISLQIIRLSTFFFMSLFATQVSFAVKSFCHIQKRRLHFYLMSYVK